MILESSKAKQKLFGRIILATKVQKELVTILDLHSIQFKEENDKLFALNVEVDRERNVFESWIDVTNYSPRQLLFWLGY